MRSVNFTANPIPIDTGSTTDIQNDKDTFNKRTNGHQLFFMIMLEMWFDCCERKDVPFDFDEVRYTITTPISIDRLMKRRIPLIAIAV